LRSVLRRERRPLVSCGVGWFPRRGGRWAQRRRQWVSRPPPRSLAGARTAARRRAAWPAGARARAAATRGRPRSRCSSTPPSGGSIGGWSGGARRRRWRWSR